MTGRKTVPMNYANYWQKIVARHHIKLVGWPETVKFANPSDIATLRDLKRLRDALKWKKCHWVRLSAAQVAAELEKNAPESTAPPPEASESTQPKRKRTRKGKENAGPAKATKRARKSTASTSKSAAVICSDADDD